MCCAPAATLQGKKKGAQANANKSFVKQMMHCAVLLQAGRTSTRGLLKEAATVGALIQGSAGAIHLIGGTVPGIQVDERSYRP